MCHERTHAPQQSIQLLDHLIGAQQQRRRDRKAQYLRSLEIDDQLNIGRLLNRQISRLFTLENAADIGANRSVLIVDICAVAHQAPSLGKLTKAKDRGQLITTRKSGELLYMRKEKRVGTNYETTGT